MSAIWVDTRWEGLHGIGRYAREVCTRLTVPWRSLGLDGAPASPAGALAHVPPGLVYSPGYNGFRRAERQVLTLHDLIHLETSWPGRMKYLAYYNAVVKPVVQLLSLPLTILTLGLFLLVINALMLMLTSWITSAVHLFGAEYVVSGFWAAFFGAIVIGLVNWVVGMVLPTGSRRD